MVDITLEGRLLCAAQQAYQILVSGAAPPSPAAPSPPPSTLIGWIGEPQCLAVGEDKMNAVLVGQTVGEVIVAYRGTEPFDDPDRLQVIADWLGDFSLDLVQSPDVPGSIHADFSHGVDELWHWVLEQLQQMPKSKPLCVTGHSKGGAMANIAAVKLAAAGYTPQVYTFEAARAGDPAFAAGFAAKVPQAVRYEFQNDIVPWVPPTDDLLALLKTLPFADDVLSQLIPSYVPVGELRFINWQAQVVGDSPALEVERFTRLAEALAMFDFDRVIDDHSIAPGSGVASVICPGVWPIPLTSPSPSPTPLAASDV